MGTSRKEEQLRGFPGQGLQPTLRCGQEERPQEGLGTQLWAGWPGLQKHAWAVM